MTPESGRYGGFIVTDAKRLVVMGSRSRNATLAIAAGIGTHVAAALLAVAAMDLASIVVVFVAIPGGLVTGLLTDRYGSELRNGAIAAGVALALIAAAAGVYGFQQSVAMGYGLDSLVSFFYGAYAIAVLPFFLPIALAEGALAAAVGNAIRLRSVGRVSTR